MKENDNHKVRQSGFKVPEGYFDGLEQRMLGRVEGQNPLNKIKGSGFTVPDGYFETVEKNIVESALKASRKTPVISLKRLVYLSGIAASILLIMKFADFSKSDLTFGNIQTTSIEQYLLEEDINIYELAQMLELDQDSIFDYTNADINVNNLEDYLIENTTIDDLIDD